MVNPRATQEEEVVVHRRSSPPVSMRPAVDHSARSPRAAPMLLSIAAAVGSVLALSNCASKHKLVTPDGHSRVPVNTEQSLGNYKDLVAREDAVRLERSELQRRVDLLTEQIAALKTYLYQQERKAKESEGEHGPAPKPTGAGAGGDGIEHRRSESVTVAPGKVVFRFGHDVGETQFLPSVSLRGELLDAARAATSISIRGRTDAEVADSVEGSIALARALRAREYLIGNGVDADKIRTWYRAAGDFVADNTSAEGREHNRRVEIETRGLDSTAFAQSTDAGDSGRTQ